LKRGDRFIGFDGSGKTYTLRIKGITDAIEAEIEKASYKKITMPNIFLACALPKKSKIDYIIEKATELGVSEVVPMVTERTIVKIDKKNKNSKQKRWERIALEASKQCGRETLPKVYEAMNFKDAIKLASDLEYNTRILPCLSEGTKELKEVITNKTEKIAVFIGPEGDFTDKEIEYAESKGLDTVSLGPLVLRVDTACLFSISAIQTILSI